jgi:ribosomal protein S27AE
MTPHNWKEIKAESNQEIDMLHCLRCDAYAFIAREPGKEDIPVYSMVRSYYYDDDYEEMKQKYRVNPDCDLYIVSEIIDS